MTFAIADNITIPIDTITERIAIVGQSGYGKTTTARVLAEGFIAAGQPVLIMDTNGVWWGLRSSADGKSEGFPVVVFGGSHGDVPLKATAGRFLAQTIAEHRISAVIDLSRFTRSEMRHFTADFLSELYYSAGKTKLPMHVVFDEANVFAPQKAAKDGQLLLEAMEDIQLRGRVRGIGTTLVSQRPQAISKDLLTQATTVIAHALGHQLDIKAVYDQIRTEEVTATEAKDSFPTLKPGQAWVWSPNVLKVFERADIHRPRTFDSSSTPKVGENLTVPSTIAQINLGVLGAQIQRTATEVDEHDPKALRARVAVLERELKVANARAPETSTVEPTIKYIDREVPVEIPVVAPDDLVGMALIAEHLRETAIDAQKHSSAALAAAEKLSDALARVGSTNTTPRTTPPKTAQATAATTPQVRKHPAVAPATEPDTSPLSKMQRGIAAALATHGQLSYRQIGLFTGYSHTSGTFSNNISIMRTRGLIEGTKAGITLLPAGRDALGDDFTRLPTGPALIDFWMNKLPTAQGRILSTLLEVWPQTLSADEIAFRTGYSGSSGTFSNNRSQLKTAELITGTKDALAAADTLGEAMSKTRR